MLVKVSIRSDGGSGAGAYFMNVSLNGVTTNRTMRKIEGYDGTNVWSTNTTTAQLGILGGSAVTANTFTNTEFYIPNYAGSNYKSISSDYTSENNSSTSNALGLLAGLWSSTSAINQITISSSTGNFVQYCTAYLYGIKNS